VADKVPIGQGPEPTAKIRNVIAVPALAVITLGIYYLYWWYQINREMVDLGRARNVDGLGDSPATSLLALFPGALIIVPPFVTLYNTIKRIQRAQEVTTGETTMNGMVVLWLIIGSFIFGILSLVIPGYIQGELNKVWERVPAGGAPELQAGTGTASAPAAAPAPPADPPPPSA
jgi:hypothetical protein